MIGFSLSEIKKFLDGWYSNRMSAERKIEILKDKISEIEGRIKSLRNVKKLLEEGIEDVKNGLC